MVKKVGAGWDNTVFLVNNCYIFHFPHRKIAAALIKRENLLRPIISGKFVIDIPQLKFLGKPSPDYPHQFHGYPKIIGSSACHADLGLEKRKQSIKALGQFPKSLHGMGLKKDFPEILWEQKYVRSDPDNLARSIKASLNNDIRMESQLFSTECFDEEIAHGRSVDRTKISRVMLHGDPYCRHLIFRSGQLCGVIDWGDCGGGIRAVDLAVVFTFLPLEYHDEFFAHYGKVSEETLAYARFAGIHSAANITAFAKIIGDKGLFREGITALKRINPQLLSREALSDF